MPLATAATLEERFAACLACHGESGTSATPGVPSLGAQPALFTTYQLFFFREGRREAEPMGQLAKEMTDADLAAFAAKIEALPPPAPPAAVPDEARYARGRALAGEHLCDTCHNPDYSGRQQMPRLAHQREDYLLKALRDYKTGARIGTQAAMPETVAALDDSALADLAYYLAHLQP